ncbi:MAG: hypothetical protein Q8K13_10425 [Parvibaculum sp.]|nr:hypothetical protein [Parvibaculum sp.]MDP2150043.1 hypothetical protein [Parvibaculum sp.]
MSAAPLAPASRARLRRLGAALRLTRDALAFALFLAGCVLVWSALP